MKTMTDEFKKGMEHAANLYEQVNPASDEERLRGDPGAGAMGAVLEFRDLIRNEARQVQRPMDRTGAKP